MIDSKLQEPTHRLSAATGVHTVSHTCTGLADAFKGTNSNANPHVSDPPDDWGGAVFGGGTGERPLGDVYREGTDILGAWIARDADGALTAHISVNSMATAQPNRVFYVYWYYEGTDSVGKPVRANRWISGRDEGDQIAGSYGFYDAGNTVQFRTVGFTTARAVTGTPGEIIIDIPRTGTAIDPDDQSVLDNANWGAPTETLSALNAEARIIVGSPKRLPQPSAARHGSVQPADDAANANFICDADV